jgi:hypothetical protein
MPTGGPGPFLPPTPFSRAQSLHSDVFQICCGPPNRAPGPNDIFGGPDVVNLTILQHLALILANIRDLGTSGHIWSFGQDLGASPW